MATPETVLDIQDLHVTFRTESGPVPAVRGAGLTVHAGEALALVGESGSGKSTVALAAIGLLSRNASVSGSIRVGGVDIATADAHTLDRLRGQAVAMIFQEPATALDPLMRVGDQVAEVIRNHSSASPADARERAVELLRHVGIPDPEVRSRAFPFEMSGGQRQRVVIAMAIANRPRLLIADEPTTALDVTVQAEILDLLRRLAAEDEMGVLLVTHNMGVVADFADRVAVMYEGELVETGDVRTVLQHPTHDYTRRLLAAVPRLRIEDVADEEAAAPPPETSAVVDVRDVSVVFGRGRAAVQALKDVSVRLDPGETVGLVGESGSGKSTLARVVLGLIHPTSGEVRVFGGDPFHERRTTRRRLRRGVGVVLQDPVASLDARMSVLECVAEPLRVHERGLSGAERRRRVAQALEAVRLPAAMMARAPRELSGGQRQRVSLARALVLNPQLLVADEPTSALDVSVQRTVLDMIEELKTELGFACLFVSHDLAVVQDTAHRVYVMREGEVVEYGSTAATLSHPRTDYTKRLLAAVPVPDPVVQRRRRSERLLLAHADSGEPS